MYVRDTNWTAEKRGEAKVCFQQNFQLDLSQPDLTCPNLTLPDLI